MTITEIAPAPLTTKTRLSFSDQVENLQLAWDSTSLGALKTCPRYYKYSILDGYSSRHESAHLRFGSEYNNALVTYHQARAAGQDAETATLTAVRYAFEHTWDEKIGRPWTTDEPTKNRETLIRSVIWYLDKFADDPLETVILPNGLAAVELSFRLEMDISSSLSGETYLLCGYLDRFAKGLGGWWIPDFKTTKYALDERYFERYSPNNQMSQYAFAGAIIAPEPVLGVVVDAMQIGVTFTRFQRGTIPRTKPQLEEWYRDAVVYIRQNEAFVESGYWPQNDTACDKFGGCQFRKVCGSSPDIRSTLLNGLFTRRVWDPLVVREI